MKKFMLFTLFILIAAAGFRISYLYVGDGEAAFSVVGKGNVDDLRARLVFLDVPDIFVSPGFDIDNGEVHTLRYYFPSSYHGWAKLIVNGDETETKYLYI